MSEDQANYGQRHIAGIDNGLDGGVVVLNAQGEIVHQCIMPTVKLGKGRKVDAVKLSAILRGFDKLMVFFEEASKHSPGVLALCSTWRSFGAIETVLELDCIAHEIVKPRDWQKQFWKRTKTPTGVKFDTKAAALVAAKRLWPSQNWTKSERAHTAHDGIVDAALIAEYGRRLTR